MEPAASVSLRLRSIKISLIGLEIGQTKILFVSNGLRNLLADQHPSFLDLSGLPL
jgi:hypothetical protein